MSKKGGATCRASSAPTGIVVPGFFSRARRRRRSSPGLRTRARRPRRPFSLSTGQKVVDLGRTFLPIGAFCWCATDPAAPKHHGISYLLVGHEDAGDHGAPLSCLLERPPPFQRGVLCRRAGAPRPISSEPLNEGWKVAITTLMFEAQRGGADATTAAQIRGGAGSSSPKQLPTAPGARRWRPDPYPPAIGPAGRSRAKALAGDAACAV